MAAQEDATPAASAAYAQELLSTFSTALGEVALVPATGGVFIVDIVHSSITSAPEPDSEGPSKANEPSPQPLRTQLWDRKTQGGFPETKELKRLVRDIVQPTRDLGHVDRHGSSLKADDQTNPVVPNQPLNQEKTVPNESSTPSLMAGNMVTSIMSAFPDRPKNDGGQNKRPTSAELSASRTAEKMVADIMNDFQGGAKQDETGGGSGSLKTRREGDGVHEDAVPPKDEEEKVRGGP
ncbi:MAG: hypothetical protein Q9171_001275 [Xanthocarpia ochracea]